MNPPGGLILVLDAGTTSTRALAFDTGGAVLAVAQEPLTQHYPRPGWVEHDAGEIWAATLACAREVVTQSGGADRFAGIGITNQRETVVAWDKASGEPLHHALVWQDRRTADACAALKEAGHEAAVQEATGLLLDPYFSATKMRWLLDNVPAVAAAAAKGTLALGTVETWLVFKLTGGLFTADASNASRTSLLPLGGRELGRRAYATCSAFPARRLAKSPTMPGASEKAWPSISARRFRSPGLAGDQQAATIGQGCLSPGQTKATYGTGAFVLANAGHAPAALAPPPARHGAGADRGPAHLCAGRLGLRRRQPDPVAARFAGVDRRALARPRNWRGRWRTAAGWSSCPRSQGWARRTGGPMPAPPFPA